ncbi:MAG: CPBP family intramembrane metalloprotease [Burkholderiales bacterium]|nr:CPBP family intramembrane metalloprotease [Burkholderiales bacterium]
MLALPWIPISLAAPAASLRVNRRWPLLLLSAGYGIAFVMNLLSATALAPLAALSVLAYAVIQPRYAALRYLGHALFIVLAVALGAHWLPGFHNPQVIGPVRYTPDAQSFTLYLNLDKPLVGCWILLVLPWTQAKGSLRRAIGVGAATAVLTAAVCLPLACALGLVGWAPKWPPMAWLWLLNNLLLVTISEEAMFRAYVQGGLGRLLQKMRGGDCLALLAASALFGLAHFGGGWPWMLMGSVAGIGYGLAYRYGGLWAAVLAHVGLNLAHFALFTYPMKQLGA